MERSLQELQARVKAALAEFAPEVRSECVMLARRKSPSSVMEGAHWIADRHGMPRRAIQVIKMARWLSVIRRDYGDEAFEATAEDISHLYAAARGGWIIIPPKTAEHLGAHPEIGSLLSDAVSRVHLQAGRELACEVDMARIIGRTGRVDAPEIGFDGRGTFAQRVGRRKPSRVVLGVVGSEVRTVVLRATPNIDVPGEHLLITAYVGNLAPYEPWSLEPGPERDASLRFWATQALVYDPSVMRQPFESSWREILEGK